MPDRDDANLFEILVGQVTQNLEIDIILGKALSVLPKAELFEPVRNLLHRRPSTDLTLSVLDRHVAEFISTREDRVAGGLSVTLTAASIERSRLSDQLIVIVQPEIDLLRCRRLGGGAASTAFPQPRSVLPASGRPTSLVSTW